MANAKAQGREGKGREGKGRGDDFLYDIIPTMFAGE